VHKKWLQLAENIFINLLHNNHVAYAWSENWIELN
jgi:hypothetical protein